MIELADALTQIDKILEAHADAQRRSVHKDLSDLRAELTTLVVRAQATVDRLVISGSTYARFADQQRNQADHVRLSKLVSTLEALKTDLEAGYLTTVTELLHADMFSNFLEMASELLDKGYKDPAAVLAGSVLEAHLRAMCAKFGVPASTGSGVAKKADVMNADLVKAEAYNTIEQKQVTADLGIRNSAAHGKYDDYSAGQVRDLIDRVRQFIIRHSA